MNPRFLRMGLLVALVSLLLQLQLKPCTGQTVKPFSDKDGNEIKRQTSTDKVLPVRRQVNNFGTASLVPAGVLANSNYQQFPRPGVIGQPNYISPAGLNFGVVGITAGGVNPCTTCSTSDYSYAQKCCSFGHQQCCSVNLISPQPVTFGFGSSNNGYSNNGGHSSWRPSSAGFTGIVYDSQYSQQGNSWGHNQREKPGSCYRISYQNQGGYSASGQGQATGGGYQSYGAPNNFGTSGGYYPISNYVQQSSQGAGQYNQYQNSGRYCRTDYECAGSQKCCGSVCSNPSFI